MGDGLSLRETSML